MEDNSHLRTPGGVSSFQVPGNACRVVIDSLNSHCGSSNQRLQRLEKGRSHKDTHVSGLGSSTSEDNGVCCAGLSELIVCCLLSSQVGQEGFERCEDATNSTYRSADRREVVQKDGQEGIERGLSLNQLQFSATEFRSWDGRSEAEAEKGEQGPEVELHVSERSEKEMT